MRCPAFLGHAPPKEATELSGRCAAMDLKAVDAGVVFVAPVVVHLELHVTEGVIAWVLGKGRKVHVRPGVLRNPEDILRSPENS